MGDWRDPDLDHLERHLEHELVGRGMTRAELVAGGGRLAAALGLGWLYQATIGRGAAFAATDRATGATKFTGTLKVMGMGTDLIEPVRQEAEKDLGFKLSFEVLDGATLRQKVATQPGAFDVYWDETAGPDIIWPTGNLVPIPRSKLTHWNQYTMLYKAGRVDPGNMKATVGDGDAAFRKQYVVGRREEVRHLVEHEDRPARQGARGACERGDGRQRLQLRLVRLQLEDHQEAARADVLGRAAEPDLEGPRRAAERPEHRSPGRGDRRRGARDDEVQGHGQHVGQGDRRARQDPDDVQEAWPLPRVLDELRSVRQPDVGRRGRARVDVVAGGLGAAVAGLPLPLRRAEGGLPRLVGRQLRLEGGGEGSGQVPGGDRLHELVALRQGRARS